MENTRQEGCGISAGWKSGVERIENEELILVKEKASLMA